MSRKKEEIVYLHPNEIKIAPFNPASRVTESSLKALRREIEDAGEIIDPLTISEDGYLADGYRRLAIAKQLGMTEVPTRIKKGYTNTDLWRRKNTGVRPMGSLDVFQAIVIHGAQVDMIPQYFRYPIERLITMVGLDMAREIAEKGYTPHIVETIALVMRYCHRKDEPEFATFVARWLIDQRQNYAVRKAIEAKMPCEDILTAINENKKLVRTWKLE